MSDPATENQRGQKIRVLICDDHELIRQALRSVIDHEPDMEVIGEASDGEQAVALASDLCPDAVVMDIEMPRVSGIEATRRIKKRLPNAVILVLTVHDSSEYILNIFEAGATGYLTKRIISKEIPAAIRSGIVGESMLSEAVLKKIVRHALKFCDSTRMCDLAVDLTDKEIRILELAAKGYSNKLIGRELNLSENTIKKYMMLIFEKLGVRSRTGAVITAQQSGLIPSDV